MYEFYFILVFNNDKKTYLNNVLKNGTQCIKKLNVAFHLQICCHMCSSRPKTGSSLKMQFKLVCVPLFLLIVQCIVHIVSVSCTVSSVLGQKIQHYFLRLLNPRVSILLFENLVICVYFIMCPLCTICTNISVDFLTRFLYSLRVFFCIC